jgi:hypothetical protein
MNICLVNGSLRGDKASSLVFLEDLATRLRARGCAPEHMGIRAIPAIRSLDAQFAAMAAADSLVLAIPLFAYCLSGGLIRFLEDFHDYLATAERRQPRTALHSIINCGFYDPRITREALRVLRIFCDQSGIDYRFSVAIGCGPAVVATRKMPLLNARLGRALAVLAGDIERGGHEAREDILVEPSIPKAILIKVKDLYEDRGWSS